jgi:hypothetical protein
MAVCCGFFGGGGVVGAGINAPVMSYACSLYQMRASFTKSETCTNNVQPGCTQYEIHEFLRRHVQRKTLTKKMCNSRTVARLSTKVRAKKKKKDTPTSFCCVMTSHITTSTSPPQNADHKTNFQQGR